MTPALSGPNQRPSLQPPVPGYQLPCCQASQRADSRLELLLALQGRQKHQLKASYLELYEEQIMDLLAPKGSGQLTVREDVCKESARVYVDGLTEVQLLNGERA